MNEHTCVIEVFAVLGCALGIANLLWTLMVLIPWMDEIEKERGKKVGK
jgi:hypothetical protein